MQNKNSVLLAYLMLILQNILNIFLSCFGAAYLFNQWWNIPLGYGGLIWLASNLIILLIYLGIMINIYE